MTLVTIGIGAGALGAGMAFGALIGRLVRGRRRQEVRLGGVGMDAQLARDIEDAASAWATAHGRPEASSLLANKVKLAWKLKYGDDPWGR
jgi:hypothetical protein